MSSNYHFHIQNFVQVSHSQIQQQHTQHHTVKNIDNTAVKEIIHSLQEVQDRISLEEEQQLLLSTDIKTILAQLKLRKPRSSIIKTCLASISSGLEKAVSNCVVAEVVTKINHLLGMIKK